MTELKNNKTIYGIYAALFILMSGVFIFELPTFVFWSPTVLFAIFLIYSFVCKKPLRFPVHAVFLLAFGVFYVLFTYNSDQSIYYQSYIFLHMFFMFIIGYNFFPRNEDINKRSKTLYLYLFIVSLIFIAYVALTYGNYLRNPALAPEERKYWSVWYPGVVIKTATGFCASMFFAVAIGSYSVFFSRELYKRIIGAALVIICFVFNIITQTRLLVFFTPVLIAAEFVVWLIVRKKRTRAALVIVVISVVFAAAVLAVYFIFEDSIRDRFSDSSFSRFFEMGLRSTRWRYALNVINDFSLTYLGGGYHSYYVGVPHNFWLYVYDYGGIVPFAIYAVFTVMTIISYVRFIRNKNIDTELKIFLTIMTVPVFIEFMVEDLLYGLPSFVLTAHFILGVFCGLSSYKPENAIISEN